MNQPIVLLGCLVLLTILLGSVNVNAQLSTAGMKVLGTTLWPTSVGYISGQAAFIGAARDNYTTGYTWWCTRGWIGVVASQTPNNVSAIITLGETDTQTDLFSVISLAPLENPPIGWYIDSKKSRLVKFPLDPSGYPNSKQIWYDRTDLEFKGLLFDPNEKVVWIITDSQIIWVDANIQQATETSEPTNGNKVVIQSSAFFRSILLDTKRKMVVMCGQALIYRTSVKNHGLVSRNNIFRKKDLEGKSVGAGKYLVGVYNPKLDVMYLGSDVGIAIEVEMQTLSLTRIFFAAQELFYSVYLDDDVIFWTTNLGNVSRVNTKTFEVFGRLQTGTANSNLKAVAYDPVTQTLHYGADFGAFITLEVQKTDCSIYQCLGCLSLDTEYCGYCKDIGTCTESRDCPIGKEWQRGASVACPDIYTVTPSSANVDGGTIITIAGSYFEPEDTKCVFIDNNVPTLVDPFEPPGEKTLKCKVPPKLFSDATRQIQVGVKWKSLDWGNPLPFTYYRCPAFNCTTCFNGLYPECGWCYKKIECSSAKNCSNGINTEFSNSTCPTISSVSPSSGSVFGGETISLEVAGLATGITYQCKFGGNTPVSATVNGATTHLTCTSPLNTIGIDQEIGVTVEVLYNGKSYAPKTNTFTYYNCTEFDRCADCKAATHPKCRWCSSPSTLACMFQTDSCTGGSFVECPTANSLTPLSDYIGGTYTSKEINVNGLNFQSLSNLQCKFSGPGAPAPTTAVFSSSTLIKCPTPASKPAAAEFQLTIEGSKAGAPTPQTEPLPFLFYTCDNTAIDCQDCIEDRKIACEWCNDGPVSAALKCSTNATALSCSANSKFSAFGQCPHIDSLTPDGDALQGGVNITLTGVFLLPFNQSGMECEFDFGGSKPTSTAFIADGNTAFCTAPGHGSVTTAKIRLLKDGIAYTNQLPFRYYDCTLVTGKCDSCLDPVLYSRCVWCGITCDSIQNCPPTEQLFQCPRITAVSPAHASILGSDSVQLTPGPFLKDQEGHYTCVFDTAQSVAHVSGSGALDCVTPRKEIGTSTIKVYYDDVLYTEDTVQVEFFDCDKTVLEQCGGACISQPFCGWCVQEQTCGPQSKCQNLWLGGQCPVVKLLKNYANLPGGEEVTLQILSAFSDNVIEQDLKCDFGFTKVNVTLEKAGNVTNIKCMSPKSLERTVQFGIAYLGAPLLQTKFPFSFVDCERLSNCELCSAKPFCGWCLSENACRSQNFCPVDQFENNWDEFDCPELRSATPATSSLRVNTQVVISGIGFIDSDLLHLKFGDVEVPILGVNNGTQMIVNTPKVDAEQTVLITLTYGNNSVYAKDGLEFRFIADAEVDPGAVGGGVAGGLVVLGGGLAAAVILLRRYYRGSIRVVVKEPDYIQVAYGSDLTARYKTPDDGYRKLETTLSRKDFALQLAIASFCPPTEQDAMAKALVHIAHAQDKAIEMINVIVREEVNSCIQENTIFRGNSLASKMFKFYSRMVGIKYLWRCMARVIAELETLGLKDAREKEKAASGKGKDSSTSLLTMSMELDPNKMDDLDGIDADTNILQLMLTCQKLFSVIVKNSLKEFPLEFRKIFVEIDQAVMNKFGSDNAAYKAIGGFFFLRFVCPSITAPHVYGLLTNPPNQLTQRQLVLISKVLQSLANMQVPGKKEKYMEALTNFIETGIPKVVKFYEDIRKSAGSAGGLQSDVTVPEPVKNNALASAWGFIFINQEKMKTAFKSPSFSPEVSRELQDALEEMVYDYKTGPKRLESGNKKGGKKGKGKKATSAPVADAD